MTGSRKWQFKVYFKFRQFGIAFPGGGDILIHLRSLGEKICRGRTDEILAILDLDLRNAFPSFEWDSIREAVAELAPDLLLWTFWYHGAASRTFLPSGEVAFCNRGAEQGVYWTRSIVLLSSF